MSRFAILILPLLWLGAATAVEPPAPATDSAAQRDYKTRPDPCEMKQKKQPASSNVAPTAAKKSADTAKPR
jgi:hypothetical protein